MNIIKGYNDSFFVTGFNGFDATDFEIVKRDEATDHYGGGSAYKNVRLKFTDETIKILGELISNENDKTVHISKEKDGYLKGIRRVNQEKKTKEVLKELDKTPDSYFIEEAVKKMSHHFETKIDRANYDYVRKQEELYLGQNIDSAWVKENLDNAELNTDINELDEQIKKLNEQRIGLTKKRSTLRSKNMIEIIEKENEMPYSVARDIIVKLQNGEGFVSRTFRRM